ncbi:hypothetical protein QLS71_001775 [Mariniflexile litorale]|uniref:HAD family hydrolase n=1 Tax=Mariniflexile litorale TaxID=3045158 RepID=A0AAU7EH26_9FLAO|nr:hypothetical protein [Mariniflexile sp. KMM 9835]MDQ8210804.1 hypothetical protein [Mariniflexile sp. KMM 9835]
MKTILVDAWNTFITKDGIHQELKMLLDGYPNEKIIVTNADKEELISFGIVNMPYPVFSLSHKPNKTNPEYFKTLLLEYNLSTENVLYFEHNEKAIASAQSLNINSFWLETGSPLNDLKLFLDSNL